jgi:hypothetical protein
MSINSLSESDLIVDVSINTDGVLYWHLFVNQTADPLPMIEIK